MLVVYKSVVGVDEALTKREKSLIALAGAHVKQCPYCIDGYTISCLNNGSNSDQMTEAVHVEAAMEACIKLVYGVQMHNVLMEKGAL